MNAGTLELLAAPLRALRRAILWWSLGLAVTVALTISIWPAFKGASGVSTAIDQLPTGVVQAFGLQNFGSPAGFLRGNLYAIFVPLLLAAAAVTLVNGQTAGEETAGRLELYLAQPVARRAVFAGRVTAALVGLVVITAVLLAAQLGSDAVFDLQINAGYVIATVLLSALLSAVFGGLAVAAAGVGARPPAVLSAGLGVAFAGVIVASVFPLSPALAPWRHVSPWDWAFGGNPLQQATDLWRFAVLVAAALILAGVGVYWVARRDAGGA